MNCPIMMECPRAACLSFVQRLEEAQWLYGYLYNVWRTLMNALAYEVFRWLPSIPDVPPGSEHADVLSTVDERLTSLSPDLFL